MFQLNPLLEAGLAFHVFTTPEKLIKELDFLVKFVKTKKFYRSDSYAQKMVRNRIKEIQNILNQQAMY